MAKGQAEVIENVLMVFFGTIILSTISLISYNFYINQLQFEIKNRLQKIAEDVFSNILMLYEIGNNSKYYPNLNETVKLAEVSLSLPSKISGRNYEVVLMTTPQSPKIISRTTQFPELVVEQEMSNIGVQVQGKVKNGLGGKLRYYRNNSNGVIEDYIVLGE